MRITAAALAGHETSRDRVRDCQRKVFGHSLTSMWLSSYAVPEHNDGGLAEPIELGHEG